MAYDERLAERIRKVLGSRSNITEKRMFGGLAFLSGGLAAPGRLTGMACALKHEAMRDRVRHITLRTYDVSAAWLKTAANGRELPMPADTLVRVLHALVEGLTYQRLLTPELFPTKSSTPRSRRSPIDE
jgi:hypothetical protein